MLNMLATIELTDVNLADVENFTLKFVDDSEYEFVGGGNAVNSY